MTRSDFRGVLPGISVISVHPRLKTSLTICGGFRSTERPPPPSFATLLINAIRLIRVIRGKFFFSASSRLCVSQSLSSGAMLAYRITKTAWEFRVRPSFQTDESPSHPQYQTCRHGVSAYEESLKSTSFSGHSPICLRRRAMGKSITSSV